MVERLTWISYLCIGGADVFWNYNNAQNYIVYYYDYGITITVLSKWALISDLFSILMWYW